MSLGTSVSISDVMNALETTSTDLGTLCTHENINVWSRWKPMDYDGVTLDSNKVINLNYGITILSHSDPKYLFDAVVENNGLGYIYHKPKKYRLGDFRNYDHSALTPVLPTFVDGIEVNIKGLSDDYVSHIPTDEPPIFYPDPEDMNSIDYLTKYHLYPDVSNLTRGVLIYYETNTEDIYEWSVGNIPWGHSKFQKFKGQTCKIAEFYSNLPYGANSITHSLIPGNGSMFYAIPESLHEIIVNDKEQPVMKDAWIDISLEGDGFFFSYDFSKVNYSFRISSVGENYRGGILENTKIGLYSDQACNNPKDEFIIGYVDLDEEKRFIYAGELENSDLSTNCYIGIFWNNKLQYISQPEDLDLELQQVSEEDEELKENTETETN